MAYGLKVQSFDGGGNTITQIDTTLGLTNYVITTMGRGSSVNVGHTPGKSRFVFIKPVTNSSGNYTYGTPSATYAGDGDICILGSTTNASTIQFVQSYSQLWADDGMPFHEAYLGAIVDYIVLEDATSVSPDGDYGLLTLTAGNETGFDSRRIKVNKAMEITSVIPAGSRGGYGSGAPDLLTSDTSTYVSISPWSFWDDLNTKSGISMGYNNTNLYHLDMSGDEPDPTDPYYQGPIFYDNYTAILLAKLI